MQQPFLKSNIVQRLLFGVITLGLVVGGSLLQSSVLKVQAAVNVLLVSNTAVPFGNVFPGENLTASYTVQLDTSVNSAVYATALAPVSGSQDMCPFLQVVNIDVPAEVDTLASATLTRPSDIIDNWQVRLTVPGIQGQISQNHTGGVVVSGGNFACDITVSTNTTPTQSNIVIIKKTVGGNGTFNFTGNLGQFSIQTISGTGTKNFSSLAPGTYTVTEPNQAGWDLTSLTCVDPSHNSKDNNRNAVIKLAAGETVTCTFTNTKKPTGGTISGMKFNDLNRNGSKGQNEPGLSGWTITLRNTKNGIVRTTVTDSSGNYSFTNLPAGTYKIREVHQKGWKRMSKNPKPITIQAGSNINNVSFGNAQKKNNERDDTDVDDLRDD